MKTKHRSRVQVVQDGKDEVATRGNVFNFDKLVDTYRVAENIFVDIDADELNNILEVMDTQKVVKMMISMSFNLMKKIMMDMMMME